MQSSNDQAQKRGLFLTNRVRQGEAKEQSILFVIEKKIREYYYYYYYYLMGRTCNFHWTRQVSDMCLRVDMCLQSNVSGESFHWTQVAPLILSNRLILVSTLKHSSAY